MKILVCISNVPDTTTKIRLGPDPDRIDLSGVQWIINPWDELALTRAVELRETGGTELVTVAAVGDNSVEPTLRKALAIGADEAVRIDAQPADAWSVASQLAAFIQAQNFDLVMCGIESSDYNGSAVGGMLAEILDWPSVSSVSAINAINGSLSITREIAGGKEMMECAMPALLVVQKGIADLPRIPSMRGIMNARRKPLQLIPAVEVVNRVEYKAFEQPAPKSACQMVDLEQLDELVAVMGKKAGV